MLHTNGQLRTERDGDRQKGFKNLLYSTTDDDNDDDVFSPAPSHDLTVCCLTYGTSRCVPPFHASTLRPASRAGPLHKSHSGVN